MSLAFLAKGAVALIAVLCLTYRVYTRRPLCQMRSLRDFHSDDAGAAVALDFTMTILVYFPIIMCTIQFILILNAFQFVKYASYIGARSAVVVIPEEYSDGGRNQMSASKKDTIREACAFAVSPVSPTSAAFPGAAAGAQSARYYREIMALSRPVFLQKLSGDFARYDMWGAKFGNALSQVEIEVRGDADGKFETFDPVSVEVIYDFKLTMPFAADILEDSGLDKSVRLRATTVMMNEGSGEKPTDHPSLISEDLNQ
jgi:hypothetical protein